MQQNPTKSNTAGNRNIIGRQFWINSLTQTKLKTQFSSSSNNDELDARVVVNLKFDKTIKADIDALTNGSPLGVYMVFSVVLSQLIGYNLNQNEVTIAAPIFKSKREGNCPNHTVFYSRIIDGKSSFKASLLTVKSKLTELLKFQNSSISEAVKIVHPSDKKIGLSSLTNVLFSMDGLHDNDSLFETSDLVHFNLKLNAASLMLEIDANNAMLSVTELNNFLADFEALLKNCLSNNEAPLASLYPESKRLIWANDTTKLKKVDDSFEASPAQLSLWLLCQKRAASLAYNMPLGLKLNGQYQKELLQDAFFTLIQRHELLRSNFELGTEGKLFQVVQPSDHITFELKFENLTDHSKQSEYIRDYIIADNSQAFNFEEDKLFRASLFQLNEGTYYLYLNIHHIISDGWSLGVFLRDLLAIYVSLETATQPELPALKIQYKDFTNWQKNRLQNNEFGELIRFWKTELEEKWPLLDLPAIKTRPNTKTYAGKRITVEVKRDLIDGLENFCRENEGTLFNGLLSVWFVLLSKYTGEQDLILGIPVAGRDHIDLNDQIGYYTNVLPVRTHVTQTTSFKHFYKDLQNKMVKILAQQEIPFGVLMDELDINFDPARNPIFDILFSFQNEENSLDNVEVDHALNELLENVSAKFDVDFVIRKSKDKVWLELTYNTAVYDFEMIENLMKHYQIFLSNLLESSELPLHEVNFMSTEEQTYLTETLNQTTVDYPKDTNLVSLFSAQAKQSPNAIAIDFENESLSYTLLDKLSNQFAHYLLSKTDLKSGDFVSVKLERDHWMLIAILGILKTGAAYVPIDLNYPADRISFIETDTNCKLSIDAAAINTFKENTSDYSVKSFEVNISAKDLAYVIYTSGSTGVPKGVLIEHGNANALMHWAFEEFKTIDFDALFFVTSICFDLSIFEIFYPLTTGKKVVILADGLAIVGALENHEKVLLNTVPSVVGNLLATEINWNHVAALNMAGEPIPESYIESLKDKISEIRNLYGPSEDTTYSTAYKITGQGNNCIGRPINNTQVYLLDEYNNLVPNGSIGEICLSGDGLSQGYLNQKTLTKEQFIANPFNTAKRLYKTGDLGRWLPTKELIYTGRKDSQVKLRGHRIELGEIEHKLTQHDSISEVVVLALETNGDKELVAYLTATQKLTAETLRNFLQVQIPAYMIPAYFAQLDVFPLTNNGKIDKRALPSPDALGLTSGVEYVAPRNETEEQLVAIWEHLLHKNKIGIKDDFFALGGHSLKATRLISEYHKAFNLKLAFKELFNCTTILQHAKLIAKQTGTKVYSSINAIEKAVEYAVSHAQNRLWLLSQFEEASIAYNIPIQLTLKGKYEIALLEKSIQLCIARHEILRTIFHLNQQGELVQEILTAAQVDFKLKTFSGLESDSNNENWRAFIETDADAPFDLENGPLLRAGICHISENKSEFYLNMHHIISDGLSLLVFLKEVFEKYDQLEQGNLIHEEKLEIQYKDVVQWQNEQEFKLAEAFWKSQFIDGLPLVDLPSSKKRPQFKTHNGERILVKINSDLSNQIKTFSQEKAGSTFATLLAGWYIILSKYAAQEEIVLGTPVAGRDHFQLDEQIGLYVNTLALKNKLNSEQTWEDYYELIKNNLADALTHQNYPFSNLIDLLESNRDTSRNAVFDILFSYQSLSVEHIIDHVVEANSVSLNKTFAKFDLDVIIRDVNDEMHIEVVYNSDVYESKMINRLFQHYIGLMKDVMAHPIGEIATLDYLSAPEKLELVETFNATDFDYPKAKSVVDLFADQVKETPDAIAVVFANHALTYADLEGQSNQFAHFLLSKTSIATEDFISIKLERSEWLMVTILGVLKTGAAYVPIDTTYPADRIAFIEQDTNCKLRIDAALLNEFTANKETFSTQSIENEISAKNLAYVMYTSGSTGTPKGVMVEHQNIVRLVKSANFYQCTSSDTLLSTGAFSFDATTFEYWGMLLNGGRLVLTDQDTLLKPELLSAEIKRQAVNVMWFTAGWFNQLIESNGDLFQDLKTVLVGGDKLSPNQIAALKTSCPDIQIINGYGPTENTTFSLTYAINEVDGDIPIGSPISNSQAYILDDQLNLCPIGVAGEICLSGDGLSRGYLNQEELTNEKFVTNPFNPASRLYKTGDLGKWTADGIIEFIGRKDDQVKIRGFRIELGEIEHALLSQAAIDDAVVIVVETETDKELVAYLTSKAAQTSASLRESLKAVLPAYMIPSHFVQLDSFPLNSNGKVDKRALPSPQELGLSSGVEYIAPSNKTEEKLVAIWQEVLKQERIGMQDDFFELGGHSLNLARLNGAYQRNFNVQLPLKTLFVETTPQNHLGLIESSKKGAYLDIEPLQEQEHYAVSASQRRLWFIDQLEGSSKAYNITGETEIPSVFEVEKLKEAVFKLLQRQEALRTIFSDDNGEPYQQILSQIELDGIPLVELHSAKEEQAFLESEFSINQWPLFKVGVVLSEKSTRILFNTHHIICDGWSIEIIAKELLGLYNDESLRDLSIQYKDYAAWQNDSFLNDDNRSSNYWKEKLAGDLPVLQLPTDYPDKNYQDSTAGFVSIYFDAKQKEQITQFVREHNTSSFAFFVSVFKVLLLRITNENHIIIGTPAANRDHDQVKDLVGFFLNTLMLSDQLDETESFQTTLEKCSNSLLEALENQSYPFEKVLEDLNVSRDLNQFPISQIFLNMIDFNERAQETIESFDTQFGAFKQGGKFDLECYFKTFENGFKMNAVYKTGLFKSSTIAYWLNEFKNITKQVLENPNLALNELVYFEYKLEPIAYPKPLVDFTPITQSELEQNIVERFESQVLKHKDKAAICCGNERLTYGALNAKANTIAAYLESGSRIGILLESGVNPIIAILACLKAGCSYVPLDPNFPEERLQYMLNDAGCIAVLMEQATKSLGQQLITKNKTIALVEIEKEIKATAGNLNVAIAQSAEAYVLYTSGSTGKPKGVSQSHKNVLHFIRVYTNNLHINAGDEISLLATYGFDAAVMDIYGALFNGATLHVYDIKKRGINGLSDFLNNSKITIFHSVPTIFRYLLNETQSAFTKTIRLVVLGGEAVYSADFENFKTHFAKGTILINGYGPTESTITMQKFLDHDSELKGRNVPVGLPVTATQVYLLDKNDKQVGLYQEGEIVYKSDYLATGYINNSEQTNKVFTVDPITQSGRVYRSGDRGRFLANGEIEFVGRIDGQIKLSGQRVELSEIEHQIKTINAVEEVLVLQETLNESVYLVAHIRGAYSGDIASLRGILMKKLPFYMLPDVLLKLDVFPLTPTGKIDRKALKKLSILDLPKTEYIAPSNETEKQLVAIWENILQKEQIGIKDDFFALGGHSLKATRLISEYHKVFHVKLSLKDLFTNTVLESHARLIQQSEEKTFTAISKIAQQESYAISDAQRRLWVLSQFEEGSVAYNMPYHTELNASYNTDNFQKAIHAVIKRHEILRTVFKTEENGEIRQWVLSPSELNFKLDYQDFQSEVDQQKQVENYISTDSYKAFDLENGPLIRAALLQISEEKYVFYFNMHHIISDGWSMEVLSKDVMAFYEAFEQNETPELPKLDIQYKDYAAWQQNQLLSAEYESHKNYWLKQFEGELPLIDLPTKNVRPAVQTHNGHSLSTYLSKETTAALKNFSQQEGGSLFMGLLASWNVLLSRYTGSNDLIIGSPIAGREHLDLENQIGFFVNTLALRNEVDESQSFKNHFAAVKENTLNAYSHQMYPFDRLVEDLDLQRDTSRNVLFDVILTLQNFGEGDPDNITTHDDSQIHNNGALSAKFDLNIIAIESGEQLQLFLTYNTDLYSPEIIEGLLIHYKLLLNELLNQPTAPILKLDLLSETETELLLAKFDRSNIEYPRDKTLVDLFSDQVKETPEKVAVVFENTTLSYTEIDEISNRLANYLIVEHEVTLEDFISIKLERSHWVVISILATIKAGGVYVPVDPDYPQERIDFIENDSNCKVILDEQELERFKSVFDDYSNKAPQVDISPSSLAYVIYTSGTTGNPKGTLIEHRNVVRLFQNEAPLFDFDSSDVWTMFHSYCFDFSVWEMYGALLNGGKLVIVSSLVAKDTAAYLSLLKKEQVTVLNQTPSAFYNLMTFELEIADKSLDLRYVIFGGEALTISRLKDWKNAYPLTKLVNMYGITETTVHVTYKEISETDIEEGKSNIGRPIPTLACYVLDKHQHILPVGLAGELYVGGEGVARGYLNRPSLTESRFIVSPFNNERRLYRSGDKVRLLPNGDLEYVGRLDDQVKIRGYRIELAEIEKALLRHKKIEEAIVVIYQPEGQEKELAAYIKENEKCEVLEIRNFLQEILLDHMIPSHFILMNAFPLTRNGKVDKRALPMPVDIGLSNGVEYVAPRNETEEQLVAIWENILQKKQIGIKDDFFTLGGHSLKAVKVLAQTNKQFNTDIRLNSVFKARTIENISKQIEFMRKQEEMRLNRDTLNEIEL